MKRRLWGLAVCDPGLGGEGMIEMYQYSAHTRILWAGGGAWIVSAAG